RLEGEHLPPLLLLDRPDRRPAEARREQPVVPRRLPAALQVAEDQRARLLPRALLDLAREPLAHPPHALRLPRERLADDRLLAADGHRPLGHDDDREEPATLVASADLLAHL